MATTNAVWHRNTAQMNTIVIGRELFLEQNGLVALVERGLINRRVKLYIHYFKIILKLQSTVETSKLI